MSGRYYFLVNDSPEEDRPILEIAANDASGNPFDVWHFFRGETYHGEPVIVINMPTDRVYHVLFDAFLVPFVSETLGGLIREAAGEDVQLVPTTHPAYWVLNVLRVHDAIDRNRSRFSTFPADEPRADLAGKPTMFWKMVLSADKISASVFRLVDWSMAIVVSESVCQHVTQAAIPDVAFWPIEVSGDKLE